MCSTEEERVNKLNRKEETDEEKKIIEVEKLKTQEVKGKAMASAVVLNKMFSFLTPEDRKIIADRKKEIQDEKLMAAAA
jgi:hypothetical protein